MPNSSYINLKSKILDVTIVDRDQLEQEWTKLHGQIKLLSSRILYRTWRGINLDSIGAISVYVRDLSSVINKVQDTWVAWSLCL